MSLEIMINTTINVKFSMAEILNFIRKQKEKKSTWHLILNRIGKRESVDPESLMLDSSMWDSVTILGRKIFPWGEGFQNANYRIEILCDLWIKTWCFLFSLLKTLDQKEN